MVTSCTPNNFAESTRSGSDIQPLTEGDLFPTPATLGPRPWGQELVLGVVAGAFSLKRLEMKGGTRGGLQYHRKKHELAVLISGELLVRFVDEHGTLASRTVRSGEVVHFAPGIIHQEIAVTDCVLIEASTPHFNDRVRVEGDFGEPSGTGLATTTEAEILAL